MVYVQMESFNDLSSQKAGVLVHTDKQQIYSRNIISSAKFITLPEHV